MLRIRVVLLPALLLALGPGSTPRPAAAFPFPPTQFVDELIVGGLDAPANSTILPDGRVLVVEQYTGNVRLIVGGALGATDPMGTIPGVRSGGEAGLIGVAVDPGFPARPYVYVQGTFTSPNAVRILRYTLTGDLAFAGNGAMALDMASKYTVLGNLPDLAAKHNGGTLRFGPDGRLYSGVGDDDSPCLALDKTKLQGKILRLDVSTLPATGAGPPRYATITPADNPFVADPDTSARLVWALGLRNPFSFMIDPVTGCVHIGDVGNELWEEVDIACTGGRNFGWPHYEGPQRSALTCAGADTTAFVAPAIAYFHDGSGWSIVSGPVYRPPAGATSPFPASYTGTQFYGDTWRGFIRRLEPSGGGWAPADSVPGQPNALDWANGIPWITSFQIAPDGSLLYTMLYRVEPVSGPGELRRLRYIAPSIGVGEPGARSGGSLAFVAARPSPAPRGAAVELAWRQPAPTPVTLRVLDVRGRVVRTLVAAADGVRAAGEQRAVWDGRDAAGRLAPAGVYVARLAAGDATRALRVVRL